MSTLVTDLRFGLRLLARSPGYTAAAVTCLALAIGANSTIFSFVDGYWMRPLPVPEASRLVRLFTTSERGLEPVSYAEYLDFREQVGALAGLLVSERRGPVLSGEGFTESTLSDVVSENYFTVLGVKAALGRVFSEEAGGSSAEPVVVMSHNLWQRRFGGDPSMIGKAVRLTGQAFTVIGVAPRGFRGTELWTDMDFWIPLSSWYALSPGEQRAQTDRRIRRFQALGRLQPGVPVQRARAEIDTVARRLEQAYPATNKGRGALLRTSFEQQMQGAGYRPLVLLGIVALVLLIACANVANLLLVRAEVRGREVAVRLALGCSRARLVRQFLTESLLIATLGAALSVLVARWLIRVLPVVVIAPGSLSKYEFRLDVRVLLFTLLLSLATAFIFGLAPAWHASRTSLVPALKGEGIRGRRRLPAREVLVAVQVTLSFVLLTGAGLLVRTFIHALRLDLGFQKREILLMSVVPMGSRERARAVYEETVARVKALPGVRQAAVAARPPLAGYHSGMAQEVVVPGYVTASGESRLNIRYTIVSPDYFRVLGTRLLAGRYFDEHDNANSRRVLIVNESMARRFWPHQNPVGRSIYVGAGERAADHEIIGVVQDARIEYIQEAPEPYFYVPIAQTNYSSMTLMAETATEPLALTTAVQAEIARIDRNALAVNPTTLSRLIANRLHPQRMAATIVAVLGLLGLVLAAIGLSGVMAYTVAQRTREIGIRIGLGAQHRDIAGMILGRGLLLTLAGCAAGLLASLAATRALSGFLYGVSPRDPLTLVVVPVVMTLVATAACYLPARRATRVDPVVALRYE